MTEAVAPDAGAGRPLPPGIVDTLVVADPGRLLAPCPVAIVTGEAAASWGVVLPLVLELRVGERRAAAWAFTPEQFHDDTPESRMLRIGHGEVGLSAGVANELGVTAGSTVHVAMSANTHLAVRSPSLVEVPAADTVEIDTAVASRLGISDGRDRWAVLTAGGLSAPVRVSTGAGHGEEIVIPRSLAALVGGPPPGTRVQLAALPGRGAFPAGHRPRRRRPLRAAAHQLGLLAELALRPLLRAPVVVVRTTSGLVPDDGEQVARLPEPLFPLLGIREGDQLILSWAGRQAVVRALADVPGADAAEEREQGTPVPAHLVVRVPVAVQAALGIPATTVVSARRRLRTLLVSEVHELNLTVAGLAVAYATLPDSRPVLALGVVAAVLFELGALRYQRAPRGRWP